MSATAESAAAWELAVTGHSQAPLTRVSLPATGRWCLVWNHSVQGFPVIDCFRVDGEQLILDSSQTPDFAAGLGYTAGRGTLESDDQHGYRIVDMNVPISQNTLRLRVGSESVNHRIRVDSHTVSLSQLAANEPVEIRLIPAGEKGIELK
ncbi:DUF1850 domain-containing protein [Marinobacter confluentis]|nr:DUF1850 domain-containing protein [Marinobacter confluentis]